MTTHEDDRRILYDYANGDFKSAKAILIKKTTMIGSHVHKNKDELFFLLKGKIIQRTVGPFISFEISAPALIEVRRGMYHSFLCEEGSILLCVASEVHSEEDEQSISMKEYLKQQME